MEVFFAKIHKIYIYRNFRVPILFNKTKIKRGQDLRLSALYVSICYRSSVI